MDQCFQLVLPFDTDSPEFARGVEVGMLYQRLTSEPRPISALIREASAEMALRMAEALGVSVHAEDRGQDWVEVTFT